MSKTIPEDYRSRRKIGLDYVRAAAILLVIASHFSGYFFKIDRRYSGPAGVLGVELFFVLSGFLIGGILLRATLDNQGHITPALVRSFWTRRWFRTLPNYLLFLLIFEAMATPAAGRGSGWYLLFLQNFAHRPPKFFDISWSLAVEEWFYLLLPSLALAIYTISGRHRRSFLVTIAVLFLVPLLLRICWGPGRLWDPQIRKVVIFRLDALMWGVMLSYLRLYRSSWFHRLRGGTFAGAGVALLIVTYAYLGSRLDSAENYFRANWLDLFIFPGFDLGCALLIPAFDGMTQADGHIRRSVERISLWSYSMYLCHEPAITVAAHLVKIYPRVSKNWTLFLLSLFVTIAWSALNYLWFELPILRLRDRWFPHERGGRPPGNVPATEPPHWPRTASGG